MSDAGPSLERLNSLEIRLYKLRTVSHLSIGAGDASGDLRPVDKPIIRALIYDSVDGSEQRVPYIPASSLHGVWRAWVEKALRSKDNNVHDLKKLLLRLQAEKPNLAPILERYIAKDLGIPTERISVNAPPSDWRIYSDVCNPFWDHDKCETLVEPSDRQGSLPEAKSAWKDLADLNRGPCKACSIFGHQGQRGRVRFTHAHTLVDNTGSVPIDVTTRVAINRLREASDPGKLFDVEAVPPGIVFYFFTIMENMTDEQSEHFEYGYRSLNLQLANLGAYGTVGCGMVSITKVCAYKFDKGIFDLDLDACNVENIIRGQSKDPFSSYPANRFPKFLNLLALANKDQMEQVCPEAARCLQIPKEVSEVERMSE